MYVPCRCVHHLPHQPKPRILVILILSLEGQGSLPSSDAAACLHADRNHPLNGLERHRQKLQSFLMSILTSRGRNLPCSHFWDLNPCLPPLFSCHFWKYPFDFLPSPHI